MTDASHNTLTYTTATAIYSIIILQPRSVSGEGKETL